MRIHARYLAVLVAAAATLNLACSSSSDDDSDSCDGSVDSAEQTGNTFTADGKFSNGQPILSLTAGGVTHTIPATDYDNGSATFDITGLPKGAYSATWYISCDDDSGEQTMSSDVPTVTIK